MSLPSPLTAGDEWIKPHNLTVEIVRVTAGLHRQVWVSGTSIYVDVHIVNNCRKQIKRIELQLERDILCYKHVCFYAKLLPCLLKHAKTRHRQPLRQWRSLPAKLEYSTAMSAPFSANQLLDKGHQAGIVFLPIPRTSGHAI